jgi:hypothetical protein
LLEIAAENENLAQSHSFVLQMVYKRLLGLIADHPDKFNPMLINYIAQVSEKCLSPEQTQQKLILKGQKHSINHVQSVLFTGLKASIHFNTIGSRSSQDGLVLDMSPNLFYAVLYGFTNIPVFISNADELRDLIDAAESQGVNPYYYSLLLKQILNSSRFLDTCSGLKEHTLTIMPEKEEINHIPVGDLLNAFMTHAVIQKYAQQGQLIYSRFNTYEGKQKKIITPHLCLKKLVIPYPDPNELKSLQEWLEVIPTLEEFELICQEDDSRVNEKKLEEFIKTNNFKVKVSLSLKLSSKLSQKIHQKFLLSMQVLRYILKVSLRYIVESPKAGLDMSKLGPLFRNQSRSGV